MVLMIRAWASKVGAFEAFFIALYSVLNVTKSLLEKITMSGQKSQYCPYETLIHGAKMLLLSSKGFIFKAPPFHEIHCKIHKKYMKIQK